MGRFGDKEREAGSISIEVVAVAPLFLIVIFLTLELSTFIYAQLALDTGCQQVARLIQATPKPAVGAGVSDEAAKGLLSEVASGLDENSLSVTIDSHAPVQKTYTHHLPAVEDYGFDETSRTSTYQVVTTDIACSYSYAPVTFIGAAFAEADGKIRIEREVSVERTLEVEEAASLW